jgi:hypothetical protein
MFTLRQKLLVSITCLILMTIMVLFFPWWMAGVGIIAMLPFLFTIVLK